MERIPQSTAIRIELQAYLSSDHVSPATGKTIAITISKNGAAYGNPNAGATNATEIGSGSYYVDLDTTDTGTTGPLAIKGAEGTIDTIINWKRVVAATNAGFTALPAVAAGANGGVPLVGTQIPNATAAANGGLPTVDANNAVKVQSGTGANQISLSSGLVTLSGTQTFNNTGSWTGNLSGSVGSVTGAVGSVTGNVGGNVTGSVGSVLAGVTLDASYGPAGQVEVNVKYVNDIQVIGDGEPGTEWGPA